MAQKAFVTIGNPPTLSGGLFQISFNVTYLDSVNGTELAAGDVVAVSVGLLDSVRIQVRNKVKALATSALGWTLSNDDVFLPDWSRELL